MPKYLIRKRMITGPNLGDFQWITDVREEVDSQQALHVFDQIIVVDTHDAKSGDCDGADLYECNPIRQRRMPL